MQLKSLLPRVIALILVLVVGLVGCSSSNTGLTGSYKQDTLTVIESLQNVIDLPADAPNQLEARNQARQQINDYISRYRRNDKVAGLRSFTTMQTALNALAGYNGSSRPFPTKLKERLKQEFKQVTIALKRDR